MIEALKNAFRLPDLRNKLLYTLLILVVYQFAAHVPVPGVNRDALQALFNSEGAGLVNVLNLLSGGAVSNFSVMANGVYPFITAQIIIQLLTPIIPQLEELQREPGGREKLNQYTYYLAIPMAALQSWGQINIFTSLAGGEQIVAGFGSDPFVTLSTIITMTAGTMFAIWLGELITEQGIGNGLSLIIFGGIVSSVPGNLRSIAETDKVLGVLIFLVITVLTMLFIVFVQDGERRIRVQYGKRVRGMKVYGGGSTYIPLKINTAGMIPLIFAQSILAFPAVIAQFFLNSTNPTMRNVANGLIEFFSGKNAWYAPVYFLAVVGFTYFYTFVMVEQQNLAEMLQKQGGFIPGVRPGRRTEEFIMGIYKRITLVGALFLGFVAVLPYIVGTFMTSNQMLIQSSGLLIVVGTVMDTMRQLESQLMMRNYEGFLR